MKHKFNNKEEALVMCKTMMKNLSGEWTQQPMGPQKEVPWDKDRSLWIPLISNGEIYVIFNTNDGSCSAAHEGVNFEMESWDGRTAKEAISKLIRSYASSIKNTKEEIEALKIELPKMERKYELMKTWIA